jgi:hypothetical protein
MAYKYSINLLEKSYDVAPSKTLKTKIEIRQVGQEKANQDVVIACMS